MLKLEATPTWSGDARSFAATTTRGGRIAVRVPTMRRHLASLVKDALPRAVHLCVPSGADQSERVLLDLGTALGPGAATVVDHHLCETPDDLQPLLAQLSQGLGARPVLVDGWDLLGSAGIEAELGRALEPRSALLRDWLGQHRGVFLCHNWTPDRARVRRPPQGPPVQLVNGAVQDTGPLWQQLGKDEATYTLVLTGVALGGDPHELRGRSGQALFDTVLGLLPQSLACAVRRLAVHGRPLEDRHLADLLDAAGIQRGVDLGLWRRIGGDLACESGWTSFFRTTLHPKTLGQVHLTLGNAFLADFRPDDPSAERAGLSILEAHRHLVAAGEYDRATSVWRYSAQVLVEAARTVSQAGDYGQAARLYSLVVEAADAGRLALPQRLRGYARHYSHFNMAHGDQESKRATERGYRKALDDWPDNALFWSRLVRVVCLQDRVPAALQDLARAQLAVHDHPHKQTFLIARTVRGLLEHDRVLAAAQVWGTYQPDTPAAHDVAERMCERLQRGWTTAQIVINSEQPLFFSRPTLARVVYGGRRWSAELPALNAFGQGDSAIAALRALVAGVRQEAETLARAYTSDLTPSHRLRKRLVLGAIDLVASRLGGPIPQSWWVFGTLHRDDDGALWLRTGGEQDRWFDMPDGLAATLTVDDLPHLARVATDADGVPRGPVLEIEPGFHGTDDQLWEAWRRMLDRAG